MALTARYASSAGGGAHDGTTEADAWSFAEMLTNAAAGQIVNFKGNHTLTAGASFTNAGTSTSPLKVRGYTTTAGDAYGGRTNGNGPLITTNFSVWTCGTNEVNGGAKSFIIYEGILFTSTRSGNCVLSTDDDVFRGCVIRNSSTNAAAQCLVQIGRSIFYDCDFELTGASGGDSCVGIFGAGASFADCRFLGGPALCADVATGQPAHFMGCTFVKGATACVRVNHVNGQAILYACTVVGNASDGFETIDAVTRFSTVIDCLFTDHGGYGISVFDDDIAIVLGGNRYDRNTSGAATGAANWRDGTDWLPNTTSATQANEYESYAGDDLRLKSGSPAREAATLPFRDIGALQHEDAGVGGGGVISGGMHAGMQ